MPKRDHESDEEYKARKKAKKALKKKKKNKKSHKPLVQQAVTAAAREEEEETSSNGKETIITKEPYIEYKSFSDAPFAQPIHTALLNAGFTEPSPVQARAWPVALAGQDLIAVAKTGSGKTLGFLLPIFHKITSNETTSTKTSIPSPKCLILSPTRELAIQIHGECIKFGSPLQVTAACIYGGTNVQAQVKELKRVMPQIIICTPGRLCDLLERKTVLSVSDCCFCVLDESDRMLDMGFEKQLNQVMKALPVVRQTLFFTATWPKSVRRVAKTFLRKGHTTEIFVGNNGDGELAANKAVTQTFVEAQDDEKDKKLYDILCNLDEKSSVVIFANTKRRVDYVANAFWQEGFTTCAVHGDKAQNERDAALQKFVRKECSIMVATDVAARGLDIKGVTHVINFDMARDVESYVHRIGRTGRAGEVGEAITFWNPDYDKLCSPALVTIAKKAGQKVPPFLQKYQTTKTNKQWKVTDAERVGSELLERGVGAGSGVAIAIEEIKNAV